MEPAFSEISPVFLLTFLLSCCVEPEHANLNNPPEQNLPSIGFTVNLCDEEKGFADDSLYRYFAKVDQDAENGMVTYTGIGVGRSGRVSDITPDMVELVLTPYNRLSFETDADVNASSSTDVIDIHRRNDFRHYELSSVSDGERIREGCSVIRFWNGDGSNARTVLVRAANSIPVEGFEFSLDGVGYRLVEQGAKAAFNRLSPECYLCSLPNIARRMEEYYYGHEDTFTTEDKYDSSRFSDIEFLGTIPRNATPDNNIVQVIDPLCHRSYGVCSDKEDCYCWNSANNPDFRWMPFDKGSAADYGQLESGTLNGQRSHGMNPSDIRYRRAKIWNYYQAENTGTLATNNYFFHYRTDADGLERHWWGVISLSLAERQ